MLNQKQNKFLNFILEGKTQSEAYSLTYSNNGNKNTIKNKASDLFNSPALQKEYKKAIKELRDKALYSKEQAIQDLTFLIDKCKLEIEEGGIKQANVIGLTRAIEQISNLMSLSVIEERKYNLEKERLEIAKSKLQKDNEDLQKENRDLLRKLVLDE